MCRWMDRWKMKGWGIHREWKDKCVGERVGNGDVGVGGQRRCSGRGDALRCARENTEKTKNEWTPPTAVVMTYIMVMSWFGIGKKNIPHINIRRCLVSPCSALPSGVQSFGLGGLVVGGGSHPHMTAHVADVLAHRCQQVWIIAMV